MKQLILILLFSVAIGFSIQAQQVSSSKNNFILMPSFQVLNGDAAISASIHLNAGIANSKNHYTMGLGIDYYRNRTVPITVDYKRFLGKKNKAFVYAGVGYSIPWLLEEQKNRDWLNWGGMSNLADYSGGFAYQFGIGYAILNKKKKGILFNIGLNSKTVKEDMQQMVFNGTNTTLMPNSKNYIFNRIAIGIGYIL